ncbi:MAG: S-methyl-5-thioribose-1-phosphate isomerase [Sporomusaceae bacterium]|nr:S-methyl-5-thioribose-1-phosphate isomerase [Sporomusaceae bacterium]
MLALEWKQDRLILLDQTLLPETIVYKTCSDYRAVADAIKRLVVRGAPAIGAAAAFAMVLGALEFQHSGAAFKDHMETTAKELKATRPTAVNLAWAVDIMLNCLSVANYDPAKSVTALKDQAIAIAKEDKKINEAIGRFGAELFTEPVHVLTHCNAGALATVSFGTALGVIRQAHQEGNILGVFADETRPLLQGARLTAFELVADEIPVTVITDNMAGWVMKQEKVKAVIVGADRIAQNGDVANKIGTYSVAVLAKEHQIPFYVAAPLSTFDFSLSSGEEIPIEERSAEEVGCFAGKQTVPSGAAVYNPAFDVTPAAYITAIITEYGVIHKPDCKKIMEIKQRAEMKG